MSSYQSWMLPMLAMEKSSSSKARRGSRWCWNVQQIWIATTSACALVSVQQHVVVYEHRNHKLLHVHVTQNDSVKHSTIVNRFLEMNSAQINNSLGLLAGRNELVADYDIETSWIAVARMLNTNNWLDVGCFFRETFKIEAALRTAFCVVHQVIGVGAVLNWWHRAFGLFGSQQSFTHQIPQPNVGWQLCPIAVAEQSSADINTSTSIISTHLPITATDCVRKMMPALVQSVKAKMKIAAAWRGRIVF